MKVSVTLNLGGKDKNEWFNIENLDEVVKHYSDIGYEFHGIFNVYGLFRLVCSPKIVRLIIRLKCKIESGDNPIFHDALYLDPEAENTEEKLTFIFENRW